MIFSQDLPCLDNEASAPACTPYPDFYPDTSARDIADSSYWDTWDSWVSGWDAWVSWDCAAFVWDRDCRDSGDGGDLLGNEDGAK